MYVASEELSHYTRIDDWPPGGLKHWQNRVQPSRQKNFSLLIKLLPDADAIFGSFIA